MHQSWKIPDAMAKLSYLPRINCSQRRAEHAAHLGPGLLRVWDHLNRTGSYQITLVLITMDIGSFQPGPDLTDLSRITPVLNEPPHDVGQQEMR